VSLCNNSSELQCASPYTKSHLWRSPICAALGWQGRESLLTMAELPENVRRNRAHWDQLAAKFVAAGEHGWACNEPSWGIWGAPEREVGMFPDNLAGTDVIELGCGTAYVSISPMAIGSDCCDGPDSRSRT
jgi:hypothetical protein